MSTPVAVVRWKFKDYYGTAELTLPINPDDGGTPSMEKQIAASQVTGPNRVNIMQEGRNSAPQSQFSGAILTQAHLESLEQWYDKRVFMRVTDDLGREMYGIFTSFSPRRVRRARNPWYHTFEATFMLAAYKQASGAWLYGRVR